MSSTQAWTWTDEQLPPEETPVIGLHLYRYQNVAWQWDEPVILRRRGRAYIDGAGESLREPDCWMVVPDRPAIPETPESRRAAEIGQRNAELDAQIAALLAQRR